MMMSHRQQVIWGGVVGGAAFLGLGIAGISAEREANHPRPSVSPSKTVSESPSKAKSKAPKPKLTSKKSDLRPVKPTPSQSYEGGNSVPPYTKPPVQSLPPKGGLTELVDKLKNGEEDSSGYAREKFGSRAPTATTREALIEAEMRPNNTWYSWWDGHVYEGASGLDADHTVALAEAWSSGARNWTEAKRIDFANDLSSPYTLNLITDTLNSEKGDRDPFDWMPKVNQCEYVKQWTSVKLRWGLTADGEEKMALHFRAEECDKA